MAIAKKKPSKKQLAARAKFTAMVRAKAKKQTGSTNKKIDKKFQAKPVGKRVVKHGKGVTTTYYESRANRSDKGKLLGIGSMFDYSVIKDIDNLKKEYFKLAKKYHPDSGGSTAQFQSLQNEYEIAFKKLLSGSKLSTDEKNNETLIDEEIRKIIDQIISLDDIKIELVGKWLWVGGNTYPVRTVLKQAGLTFIKKQGVPYWVYKGVESSGRGKMSLDEIKNKYGTAKFDLKPTKKISGIQTINKTKFKSALLKLKKYLNKRSV